MKHVLIVAVTILSFLCGVVENSRGDGALPEAGLRLIVEEAKKTAKVECAISLNEIADLSILREVQKELEIRPK